ncbi:MAG: hypothetical protein IH984_11535 [Planctomycetes bacterium]|nr:hypothetical protein [Planctomycetota bacterium]
MAYSSLDKKVPNKEFELLIATDIRDQSYAIIDARMNEETAFGIIMVTDINKDRVERAQHIRKMIYADDASASDGPTPELLEAKEEVIVKQREALSEFLTKIAAELSPH